MAGELNVWKMLYEEEAAQKAQNLIASAFGADKDPSVLVAELDKVSRWLMDGDEVEIAQRLVHFVAAMAMLSRWSIDFLARQIASVKLSVEEYIEPDEEAVRNQAFDLLSEYAADLRELASD